MLQVPPIVDAHMHLWDLTRHYYAWLQDDPLPKNPAGDVMPIAYRSYLIEDYLADTRGWPVAKAVHIECGLPKQNHLSETDWLESLAVSHGYPNAIVAGANLEDPDIGTHLERQALRSHVRGVRQIVNWHRNSLKTYTPRDLLDDPAWRRGFGLLGQFGLSFDLQIYPAQMEKAAWLADAHPETQIILNHAGMPTDRDEAGLLHWRKGMALLSKRPNVAVKISGLGMVDRGWTVDSIRPFVLQAIACFGVERSMFASNFPVDRIHGLFSAHAEAFAEITRDFSLSERHQLFAETALRIYRI